MTAVIDEAPARSAPDPARVIDRHIADTEARLELARRTGNAMLAAETRLAAEDVHIRAMRKRYPAECQLRASATVRLAERTLALTIRAGQHAGRIRRQGDNTDRLPSPNDIAGMADLGRFYVMADDVTDEEFAAAIRTCMAHRNTSRAYLQRVLAAANGTEDEGWIPDPLDRSPEAVTRRRELIRELAGQGLSSRQISAKTRISEPTVRRTAADMGVEIPADTVMRGRRRADSNHIVDEVVASLDGLVAALELVDVTALDPARKQNWAAPLTDSLRALNRFAKQINI
jgi:hypothetical protein